MTGLNVELEILEIRPATPTLIARIGRSLLDERVQGKVVLKGVGFPENLDDAAKLVRILVLLLHFGTTPGQFSAPTVPRLDNFGLSLLGNQARDAPCGPRNLHSTPARTVRSKSSNASASAVSGKEPSRDTVRTVNTMGREVARRRVASWLATYALDGTYGPILSNESWSRSRSTRSSRASTPVVISSMCGEANLMSGYVKDKKYDFCLERGLVDSWGFDW